MGSEGMMWLAFAKTDLGEAVRYPGELALEEYHVQDAIKYATEIIEWAEGLLHNGDR